MSQSSAKSEKITAMISTIVAVVILAAGVTAQQQHAAPRDELTQLESDFRYQLENAFRHDTAERKKRMAQLEQVYSAWQNSAQTTDNRQELADWLLESTIRSMPGTIEDLPKTPTFLPEPVESTPVVYPVHEKTLEQAHSELEQDLKKADAQLEATEHPPEVAEVIVAVPTPVEADDTPTVTEKLSPPKTPVQTVSLIEEEKAAVADEVQINLTELAARIAGYHSGLDVVETRLLIMEEADLAKLTQLVEQLDGMTRNFRFIKLYYDALSEAEQRAVTAPRSLLATLTEIERQINRVDTADAEDFLSDFDVDIAEQAEQLREKLAEIKRRADW